MLFNSLFIQEFAGKYQQFLSSVYIVSNQLLQKYVVTCALSGMLTAVCIPACYYRQGSSPYWPEDFPASTSSSHWSSAPGVLPYKLYGRSPEGAASQGQSMLKLAQQAVMHSYCSHCKYSALHATSVIVLTVPHVTPQTNAACACLCIVLKDLLLPACRFAGQSHSNSYEK